ncbi:hypothetical protein ACIRRA_20420 [Nocardia sp. NPDC101769]|uniref:hypothetical protein n=1 Tax=Nocardia sp. NPDC101769 TaxID=3364333 RepID=UPI00381E46B4
MSWRFTSAGEARHISFARGFLEHRVPQANPIDRFVLSLAKKIGLMNPVSKQVWKALGTDGATTRYRSEPDRPGQVRAA